MTGADLRALLDALPPETLSLELRTPDDCFLTRATALRTGWVYCPYGSDLEATSEIDRAGATPVLILE